MLGAIGAWLFGKKAAGAAVDVVDAVGRAVDSVFTSDEERMQAQAVLEKLRQQPALVQAEINKIEAAHPSVFVAGWRPAIGWVCVVSLAAYYPPRFIAATVLWIRQVMSTGAWVVPPEVGVSDILGLVAAMLGMAGLRTYERGKGMERN